MPRGVHDQAFDVDPVERLAVGDRCNHLPLSLDHMPGQPRLHELLGGLAELRNTIIADQLGLDGVRDPLQRHELAGASGDLDGRQSPNGGFRSHHPDSQSDAPSAVRGLNA